ncbi:MAG: hypothetical protein ACP5NS_01270 [Candidatus Pacearchaeota archaeon]
MLTIELFGLSRTGKTSTLRGLASTLEREGQRCAVIGRPPIDFKECSGLEDFHARMLDYLEAHIPEAKDTKPDYLLMDRGPYDREIMLEADHADGQVSGPFYGNAMARLLRLQTEIDIPLLFLVEPATSLARVHTQRDEGLDYSYMCVGLNTRDTPVELGGLFDRYTALQRANSGIVGVYAGGSAEDTLQSVLRTIESEKVKRQQRFTE